MFGFKKQKPMLVGRKKELLKYHLEEIYIILNDLPKNELKTLEIKFPQYRSPFGLLTIYDQRFEGYEITKGIEGILKKMGDD